MKRTKLYYTPGMISLIGLPFLIFFFYARFKPLASISIVLTDDRITEDNLILRYSKYNFYKFIADKKVNKVDLRMNYLTQDSILNAKLNSIKREIWRLKSTGDSTAVLEVILGDSNTYGQFIWLVNQALIYQMKRWVPVDNKFYFLNSSPKSLIKEEKIIEPLEL